MTDAEKLNDLIDGLAEFCGVTRDEARAIVAAALAGECEPIRILEPLTE